MSNDAVQHFIDALDVLPGTLTPEQHSSLCIHILDLARTLGIGIRPEDLRPGPGGREHERWVRRIREWQAAARMTCLLLPLQPSPSLTPADLAILAVLAQTPRKSLTFDRIQTAAVRLRAEQKRAGILDPLPGLSERTIRGRVPVLIKQGLVERPPGTEKKGVAITDAGLRALERVAGKLPESRR